MLRASCRFFSKFNQDAFGKAVQKGGPTRHLTTFQVSVPRFKAGALLDHLNVLKKHDINCEHISSRTTAYEHQGDHITMFFDIPYRDTEPKVKAALDELKKTSKHMSVVGSWSVPWYPTSLAELDRLDMACFAAGAELIDDPQNPHPGFHDQEYRKQRRTISEVAASYRHGQKITPVNYRKEDLQTWAAVWDKLTALYPTHACKEFNHVFPLLVENAGYSRDTIPDLQTISDYLMDATGFCLRPVTGLLSPRDFLQGLAFRCFHSTQYIRHPSKPFYTPEPDVVHELMGHVPLFANPDFCNFSQKIGLMSLGADDDLVWKLTRCYWYTVEFGLVKEAGARRVFGAGILSSFGELEYCLSKESKSEYKDWDPFVASELEFPITKYQPVYFVARSFKDIGAKMDEFGKSLNKPFNITYNHASGKIRTYAKHHPPVHGADTLTIE